MPSPARRKAAAQAPLDPETEAALDRILPPIDVDENDPGFRARLKAAVEEALADPRPPLSGEQVRRRLEERHAARLRRGR